MGEIVFEVVVGGVILASVLLWWQHEINFRQLRKDWDEGLRELALLLSEAESWKEAREMLKDYEPKA
jgi:hypothetical protein